MKPSRILPPLLLLLAAALPAPAQRKVTIPAPKADTPIENLVRVVAPAARCAALSDTLGLLAIGHHARHKEAHVSLFHLDKDGQPGNPATVKLPCPESLARCPHAPMCVAFHPKLPLLYVWQDIDIPRTPKNEYGSLTPTEETASLQLDHLFIYSVEREQPELLVSMCRGAEYAVGQSAGDVSVDQAGARLYVPNLKGRPKTRQVLLGSFVLEADGLPLLGKEGDIERKDAPTAESRAAHIKALNDMKNAGKPVLPQRITPAPGEIFQGDVVGGCGFGYHHIEKDLVMFGSFHVSAVVTWAPEDRRTTLNATLLQHGYRTHRLVGHPSLPAVYVTNIDTPWAYRFEHVDGYVTLLPQEADCGFNLATAPVVLARAKKLAFGCHAGRVILVSLDDKGRFKPERTQTVVGNHHIQALVYSEKFDRLYVGVEKPK